MIGSGFETDEIADWNAIKDSSSPRVFQKYLEKYPSGFYRHRAIIKLGALERAQGVSVTSGSTTPIERERDRAAQERRSPPVSNDDGYSPSRLYRFVSVIAATPLLALWFLRFQDRKGYDTAFIVVALVALCLLGLAALLDRGVFRVRHTQASGFEVPGSLAAGMLLVALAPLPYGYYTLLRLVVCGVGIYGAWLAYDLGKTGWVLTLGLIAFLFNPLIPVYLDRETWAPIDVGAAVVFVFAIFSLRVTPKV